MIVELDPGLAFGTGHHATTALCLEWLDAADLAGKTVLDYGCGSGILAIAALRLGAARAIAVDHDPQALEATRDNAAGERGRRPARGPVPPMTCRRCTADVLVANILAGPLVELAPRLDGAGRPRRRPWPCPASWRTRPTQVAAAYAQGFDLEPPRGREDWTLIAGRRRHPCH